MSVSSCTEKLNIVSNNHWRTQKRDFPALDRKIPLFGKFGPQNQHCQFKRKFGISINSNTRIK